jgi:hypothetical protein
MNTDEQRVAIAKLLGWKSIRQDNNQPERTMNKEQQRIAIAEACGWLIGKVGNNVSNPKGDERPWKDIPDYLNDLNAMHEAKLSLSPEELGTYTCVLIQMGVDYGFNFMVSTAEQQAEAFLVTLKLLKLGQQLKSNQQNTNEP